MTTAIATPPRRPPHGPPVARQTLFGIGADLVELDNLIEELGGDVSDPAVESAITTWFSEIAEAEGDKLAGYVAYIRQLDMEADAAIAFVEHFSSKANTRRNRISWLKGRMIDYLMATQRAKAATSDGQTVSIQKNGGRRPVHLSEGITIDQLPERFVKTVKAINHTAIGEALAAGETLPFAWLGETGVHLRIR